MQKQETSLSSATQVDIIEVNQVQKKTQKEEHACLPCLLHLLECFSLDWHEMSVYFERQSGF
jgi:hypothetical protein